MITEILLSVVLALFGIIFGFLPIVTLEGLPLIGTEVSNGLLFFVTKWNAFLVTFPYAETAWNVFLLIILPFELLILLSKFFLGSRSPASTHN